MLMHLCSINVMRFYDFIALTGMLLLDSDVFVTCDTLRYTHSVWRSARTSIAGYFPRLHVVEPIPATVARGDKQQVIQKWRYEYFGWLYVWWNSRYSLLHSAGAELHRELWQVGSCSGIPLDVYGNDIILIRHNFLGISRRNI